MGWHGLPNTPKPMLHSPWSNQIFKLYIACCQKFNLDSATRNREKHKLCLKKISGTCPGSANATMPQCPSELLVRILIIAAPQQTERNTNCHKKSNCGLGRFLAPAQRLPSATMLERPPGQGSGYRRASKPRAEQIDGRCDHQSHRKHNRFPDRIFPPMALSFSLTSYGCLRLMRPNRAEQFELRIG